MDGIGSHRPVKLFADEEAIETGFEFLVEEDLNPVKLFADEEAIETAREMKSFVPPS